MGTLWRFKKIVPLAIAISLGAGIIVVAVQKNHLTTNETSADTTHVEESSWRDSFSFIVADTSTPLSVKKSNSVAGTSTASLLPVGATETLAREFLLDYIVMAKAKGAATVSDTEAEEAANRLMQKVSLPPGKQYRPSDLRISSDNSPAAITTYTENIKKAMLDFSTSLKKSDIEIVYTSPTESAGNREKEYARTNIRYEKLVNDLLSIPAPSRMAPLHLRLVQGYADMRHYLTIMMTMFDDPVKGLAALREYRVEVSNLMALAEEYEKYATKQI